MEGRSGGAAVEGLPVRMMMMMMMMLMMMMMMIMMMMMLMILLMMLMVTMMAIYISFCLFLQHRLDHPDIHATVQQRLAHYTARKHSTTRERNRKS